MDGWFPLNRSWIFNHPKQNSWRIHLWWIFCTGFIRDFVSPHTYMGVSKNGGTPKWMVYCIMENPMNKQMVWGGLPPLFFGSTPIYFSKYFSNAEYSKWILCRSNPKVLKVQPQSFKGPTPKWRFCPPCQSFVSHQFLCRWNLVHLWWNLLNIKTEHGTIAPSMLFF